MLLVLNSRYNTETTCIYKSPLPIIVGMNNFNFAEILRRLENMIRIGAIAEVDHDKALVRVMYDQTDDGQPVLTAWRPWLTHRAGNVSSWSPPEVGEQVLLISPGGEMALAIVVPGIYSTNFPPADNNPNINSISFGDGVSIEYDSANQRFNFNGGDLNVNDGDVSDSAGTLSGLRNSYNLHTHIGNLGAPTSTPDQVDP